MKEVRIEFQYFPDCPNWEELLARTRQAIDREVGRFELIEIIVLDDETARRVRFRGSPTLLIDGIDLTDVPEPENPALTCRYYLQGLPSVEQIRQRIATATFLG